MTWNKHLETLEIHSHLEKRGCLFKLKRISFTEAAKSSPEGPTGSTCTALGLLLPLSFWQLSDILHKYLPTLYRYPPTYTYLLYTDILHIYLPIYTVILNQGAVIYEERAEEWAVQVQTFISGWTPFGFCSRFFTSRFCKTQRYFLKLFQASCQDFIKFQFLLTFIQEAEEEMKHQLRRRCIKSQSYSI